MIEAVSGALVERGEGFTIDCSLGAVSIPTEASHATEALQIALPRLPAQR